MVLFTSGWMVPLASSSVGRSRLSTLTVWNSSGWATVRRFGSTVISCFVGAALGSLEQATETASRTRHNRKAAAAPYLAALELKKHFACDVMGSPPNFLAALINLQRLATMMPPFTGISLPHRPDINFSWGNTTAYLGEPRN